MKKPMKRILALALLAVTLFAVALPAFAACSHPTGTDAGGRRWGYDKVNSTYHVGYYQRYLKCGTPSCGVTFLDPYKFYDQYQKPHNMVITKDMHYQGSRPLPMHTETKTCTQCGHSVTKDDVCWKICGW